MSLFLSQEEVNRRMNHSDNLIVKHKVIGHGQASNGGRPKAGKNLSVELKAVIGVLAKSSGVKNTAEAFGIHQNQVGAYKDGKTSDRSKPDVELRKVLESNINVIEEKVVDKILKSLDSISEDKISKANYATLTKGASNLSGVLDKLRDKSTSNVNNTQFVFYGVPPREEKEYNVIEVEAVAS